MNLASTSADLAESLQHKITFDISVLDDDGLLGPPGGKRALSYEFCIPNSVERKKEVAEIDPTVRFFSSSPGRIDCGSLELPCIGSTNQKNFIKVLLHLTELTYIKKINQCYFG